MFFLLSKLLLFLITPVFWIFALLCIGLFSKQPRRKRTYLILCVVFLYLFSNKFLFNEVAQKWEPPFTKIENVDKYDYAIVLGGFSTYDSAFMKVKFTETSDRLWQSLQLYYQKKVKKLFISGGSGSVYHQDESEADKVKAFLLSINIPDSSVIMEMTSRNTHENAVNTASWLKKHHRGSRCLLVTSGTHMRRALGCFKKAGVNVTPYTTNKVSNSRKFDFDILILPQAGALYEWEVLIKEWVGCVAYKIAGYM
jgi:uncharacterized SAM-binding protein YcdF (DUF218 family)